MDISTLLGLISGILLIFLGITQNGSMLSEFIHLPSMFIVFGGIIGAIFINYPIEKLANVFKLTKNVLFKKDYDTDKIIDKIIALANIARKEGLLALEEEAIEINDEFFKKGILLVVDGTDPVLVKNILETELDYTEYRHTEGQGIYESMAAYAPGFGMIGTLIGLIAMLKNINDPDSIGPNMAVALVTTFYGSILSNLIFKPIAGKLKVRSDEELLGKQMIIEGILSIQAGENPRIIEEKLKAFLANSNSKAITNDQNNNFDEVIKDE